MPTSTSWLLLSSHLVALHLIVHLVLVGGGRGRQFEAAAAAADSRDLLPQHFVEVVVDLRPQLREGAVGAQILKATPLHVHTT